MISSIRIKGFRGFKRFSMGDLGRVNLLVGTNNSGKTSLLEALYLLTSQADPWSLWHVLWRRGERVIERARQAEPGRPGVDVSHLFTGHELHLGSVFHLSATNQNSEKHLSVEVLELTEKERGSIRLPDGGVPKLGLRLRGSPPPAIALIPLNTSGTLSSDSLDMHRRTRKQRSIDDTSRVQYITTEAMDGDNLVKMWNGIALTADEELVLSTLARLDPGIERIAAQASTHYLDRGAGRSGFIVKHKSFEKPVPIGSMGDGLWRLFSLAIAITQCRGGFLLVDEIDTGLHYTAMSDMWKLIMDAAYKFDVQVFATTHSSDCLTSLASHTTEYLKNLSTVQTVSVQRIERDNNHAVPYTQEELQIATQHAVEVR